MIVLFILIGLVAGVSSGIFGIGGGILVVPALTFLAGFGQEKATGTSLAILLPPVGILACLEYYRNGQMDLKAALWVALGLLLGAWLGARVAHRMGNAWLKPAFGVFLILLGAYIVWTSWKAAKGA